MTDDSFRPGDGATPEDQTLTDAIDAADIQMAAVDGQEMGAKATGAEGTEALAGQGAGRLVIAKPPAGTTRTVEAEPGQEVVLDFDTAQAQVAIQGNNLVLIFPDGAQIVFLDLLLSAGSDGVEPIMFLIDGNLIPAESLINSVIAYLDDAGTGDLPTIDTALDVLAGSGNNVFTGPNISPLGLLDPAPVIDPTALQFALIEPDDEILIINGEPTATDDGPDSLPEATVIDEALGFLPIGPAAFLANGPIQPLSPGGNVQALGSPNSLANLPFQPLSVSGNLLPNDAFGANGPGVPPISAFRLSGRPGAGHDHRLGQPHHGAGRRRGLGSGAEHRHRPVHLQPVRQLPA